MGRSDSYSILYYLPYEDGHLDLGVYSLCNPLLVCCISCNKYPRALQFSSPVNGIPMTKTGQYLTNVCVNVCVGGGGGG